VNVVVGSSSIINAGGGSFPWHPWTHFVCSLPFFHLLIHTHCPPTLEARLIASMADEPHDMEDVSRRSPGTVCYVAALDTTLRIPSPEPFIEVSLFLTTAAGGLG
jgi:hypothetical protein